MAQASSCLLVMKELLADGEWHTWREVVVHGAAYIPETQALHTNERMRKTVAIKNSLSQLAQQQRVHHRDRQELIRIGSYAHARDLLSQHVKYKNPGMYEYTKEKIRLQKEKQS